MNKKYNTEEERLEAKRARDKKWRDNRTQEQIDKKNANERKRVSKLSPKQREDRRDSQRVYAEKIKSVFVTYKHSNDNGDIYIGSGTIQRANAVCKATRRSNHFEAFKGSPKIEILATFKNRDIAELYEHCIINMHGIKNLVNVQKAIDINTYKLKR